MNKEMLYLFAVISVTSMCAFNDVLFKVIVLIYLGWLCYTVCDYIEYKKKSKSREAGR